MFNKAYWNLMLGGISVLSLLLPYFIFHLTTIPKRFDDPEFSLPFHSTEFKICGAILFAVSCPVVLDVVIDFFTGNLSESDRKCLIGRLSIGLVTCLVGLHFFVQADDFKLFQSDLLNYWFALWSIRIVTFTSLVSCLCSLKPDLFTFRETLTATISLTLLVPLRFSGFCFGITLLDNIAGGLISVWCVFVLLLSSWWGCKLWKTRAAWSIQDYSCLLYWSLLFLSFGLGPVITFWIIKINDHTNLNPSINTFELSEDSFVLVYLSPVYMFMISQVALCVIPGQIARYTSAAMKDEIIVTKQAYVRYISHELRTPMNTIKMGIKFCLSQIPEQCRNDFDKSTRETLEETSVAVQVALEILNDLLLYDKLEAGLITLKKEVIGALDFISHCIKMFAVQIRAKNISLSFINKDDQYSSLLSSSSSDTTGTVSTESGRMSILETDKCFIDKSKLGEVVRNIMSNAIKFTPDNGNIELMIGFIPGASLPCKTVSSSSTLYAFAKNLYDYIYNKCKSSIFKRITYSQLLSNEFTNPIHDEESGGQYKEDDSDPLHINDHTVENGLFVIEIKDSGVGISLENQTRLFKDIVQFDPDKLQGGGGSGLGLWISKSIVDMHNGRISVHSEGEGFGSTFRLEIPMSRERYTIKSTHADDNMSLCTTIETLPNTIDTTQEKQNRVKIFIKKHFLVVDDSKSNRKMLTRFLEQRGHTSDEAENGLMAVQIIKDSITTTRENINNNDNLIFNDNLEIEYPEQQQHTNIRYDAILMDFVMPKLNGPDATSRIRELGYTQPIIGITGNVTQADYDIFIDAGATEVLTKPLDIDLLWDTVKDTYYEE